jgi:hypothetical protein
VFTLGADRIDEIGQAQFHEHAGHDAVVGPVDWRTEHYEAA